LAVLRRLLHRASALTSLGAVVLALPPALAVAAHNRLSAHHTRLFTIEVRCPDLADGFSGLAAPWNAQ
jgi:hypothetical protein